MSDATARKAELVVIGAGPAGRGLAHRAIVAGVDTVLVDRRPDRPWDDTYAAWTDELPSWVPDTVTATAVPAVAVYAPDEVQIPRGYTVLDSPGLQTHLAIPESAVVTGDVAEVSDNRVELRDGRVLFGATVIDARGSRNTPGPEQTAFGVFVTPERAAAVLGAHQAVLMDWRPHYRSGGPSDTGPASFLYVVPITSELVLMEETCLAAHPAVKLGVLRERLRSRLSRHGLNVDDAIEQRAVEQVDFTLTGGGPRPWRHTPMTFGAAGALMHPATGYSVATSLSCADPVVDAIARGDDPAAALWPQSARAVHRLRRRGLNAALALDADETVAFFGAFFRLPPHAQRAYLSDRSDLRGVMSAMLAMVRLAERRIGLKVAHHAAAPARW
ncbi:lycopene cyclase family protein [Williamsia sp. CHRR-6]|uniref:lycopene cyclase family protein n=1 Tax=Williamsia sp. CHRR-6 TaxID=2835871 RepID=UPI001BDAAD6F|nr:lycopene cyclase family protein [Williamsia sp. CHRR-6]MBT0568058.1 hypothetical protein [Williamsia sp. CHRR-6]